MDANHVRHAVDDLVGSLADIAGTIRLCERRIWDASNDTSMKAETETALNQTARVLSAIGRLIDWELEAAEKLVIAADGEIKRKAAS